ncbi:MAG TPA: uroporphyrinogen decarboxylase [Fimbriimonadaceae bacterium]|nr:uroporphyrinogen decarboxylase [Fimbriimonadaceae bacterium]
MTPLFLRAARGEKTERPPIWVMRQAGRYLPEYRGLRAGRTMLEAVSDPEIAVEATLQPIRRFGFDAAILFSDLTVAFTPMGAPFEIKENVGPVVERPIRSREDFDTLHSFDPNDGLSFVMESIRELKKQLEVPLIGFTGAPFTLASYLIEGGPSRDLKRMKALMYSDPALWHDLMQLLATVVRDYLQAQVAAGADAVQVFDSWIGAIDARTYREYVQPHMEPIFDGLKETGAPAIHFGTGTAALLDVQAEAGGDVIGVDWRISLIDAAKKVPGKPLQGNLDPAIMLTNPDIIRREATRVIEAGRHLPGHIFNLGHGIYPDVPLENVEALVRTVQDWHV